MDIVWFPSAAVSDYIRWEQIDLITAKTGNDFCLSESYKNLPFSGKILRLNTYFIDDVRCNGGPDQDQCPGPSLENIVITRQFAPWIFKQ